MLCGPRGRAAAELLPGVDELLVHRAPWIDPEPAAVDREAELGLVDELGRRRIDRAIVLTSHHQSPLPLALLLRLARVPFVAATSVDYPGSLLDLRHGENDRVHEVERGLSLVGACGYELPAGDEGWLAIRRSAGTPPGMSPEVPYVVVHPGASVPARAWAPERNAALVDALLEDGRRVVVTGSAGEIELTARVAGGARPEVVDLGGATSLAELAEVLAGAEAVVVGNTGPAHLAAAVRTPVVSLFAPTVPAVRWRPWKVAHELLHVEVRCAGCRARECPVPGHPCLEGVSTAEVLAAVERLAPRATGSEARQPPVAIGAPA
ncbi:MAG: glycosyltransferase family 9 protein [Thermoleophilaceae bacterium]|nr:glycosyltransferase family 9 protein [Thermoleophilaceae bacterium]